MGRLSTYLLFGITALTLACDAPPSRTVAERYPPASRNEQEATELNRRPSEQYEYHVQWGDLILPLERYANPNGYRGSVDVDLATLLRTLDRPLKLIQKGEALSAELYTISKDVTWLGRPRWFADPARENTTQLREAVLKELADHLREGDVLRVYLGTPDESIYVGAASFRVRSSTAEYEPDRWVIRTTPSADPFQFQLVSQTGKPQLLRIDTTAASTRHILDLYAAKPNTKILHVPDFRTQRRVLLDEDELFQTTEIRRSEIAGGQFDLLALNEFTDLYDKPWRLEWGDLRSYGNSDIYPLDSLRANFNRPLRLRHRSETLRLLGTEIILKTHDRAAIRYLTDDLRQVALWQELAQLPARSSIYFRNIVVETAASDTLLFPIDYAFHIGDPVDYDLRIRVVAQNRFDNDPHPAPTAPEVVAYPPDSLHHQLARILELPETAVYYQHLTESPRLEISVHADQMSKDRARTLILRELFKRYPFEMVWPRWNRFAFLRAPDPARLEMWRTPLRADEIPPPAIVEKNTEQGVITFQHVSLDRLLREIGREFRLQIVDETGLDGVYSLELDLHRLDRVKQQLYDHYGLQLDPAPETMELLIRFQP